LLKDLAFIVGRKRGDYTTLLQFMSDVDKGAPVRRQESGKKVAEWKIIKDFGKKSILRRIGERDIMRSV
jgi:hypothetical protein